MFKIKQKAKNLIYQFKSSFDWVEVYNSPFITPVPVLYYGKLQYGTPYFYPRKWAKTKTGSTAVPKKIGFDFVGLGYKLKWDDTDYRFEYAPLWSFVFFKWQLCIFFIVPHVDNYWTSWLFYKNNTDKSLSKKERIEICKQEFPQKYTRNHRGGAVSKVDYYDLILKSKYV